MKRLMAGMATLVLAALLLAGCSKNSPTAPDFSPTLGKVNFAVDVSGNPKSNVVSGKVTIAKGSLTQAQTISMTNQTGTFTFQNIQVGNWTLAVKLFDNNGTEIYTGEGTATVKKDQTTTVKVHVDQNTGNLKVVVETDNYTPTPTVTSTPIATPAVEKIFVAGYMGKPIISILYSDGSGEIAGNGRYNANWETNSRGNALYAYHASYPNPNYIFVSPEYSAGTDLNIAGSQPRFSWLGGELAINVNGNILTCTPDGLNQTYVTSGGQDELPCWTPDNRILFSRNGGIFLLNAPGGEPVEIISQGHVTDCSANLKVLYYSNQTGVNQVYMANMDGSGVAQLTHTSGNCFNAHFNRDCSRIVFQADDGIWTMDENGGSLFQVSNRGGGNPFFVY